jgi:hypothetical protein
MTYYRLYFMNGRTGHIERFEEFEAVGDDAAIERADGNGAKAPLELWSGCQKIYRLEPPSAAALPGQWRLGQR